MLAGVILLAPRMGVVGAAIGPAILWPNYAAGVLPAAILTDAEVIFPRLSPYTGTGCRVRISLAWTRPSQFTSWHAGSDTDKQGAFLCYGGRFLSFISGAA